MHTEPLMLLPNHRFEVEVVPLENTPKNISASILALSSVSPIRSSCEILIATNDKPVSPGKHFYDRLELKRALSTDKFLYTWRENWANNIKDYRDVYIRQFTTDGAESINQWRLQECWPCLWEGPAFNAMQSDISYERLEIYFSKLEWQ
jgi:phage tail-like protein